MTNHQELFSALAAPFEPNEVKVRTQGGKQLHYVTARTVMNRLDNVLGPENWSDDFVPNANSVLCRLTIRLPDGSVLTKADAGGYAGMADSGDDDKSGYSDAFKRAGVKFGIGRYLYRDGVPSFVQEPAQAQIPAKTQARTAKAPKPAYVPRAQREASSAEPTAELPAEWGSKRPLGRDFYDWLTREDKLHHGVFKAVTKAALAANLPVRLLGWDRPAVERGYRFALTFVQSQAQTQMNGTPR